MKNLLIQRFTLQRSIMSLLYKNYSLVVVMYLLIRFKNTFQRNTKNTDRNGVNEQNTNTTYSKKDNFRQKGLLSAS